MKTENTGIRYQNIYEIISLFMKLQEIIHQTPIKDEIFGTHYLVEASKMKTINDKLILEMKQFYQMNKRGFNISDIKTVNSFFKIIEAQKEPEIIYDFIDKDETWFNPGVKKVG